MSVFVEICLRDRQAPEEPFHTGQGIGQFADWDECDAVAKAAGARPLSDYSSWADPELIDEIVDALEDEDEAPAWAANERSKTQQWHDPAAGLLTVRALLQHFQAKADQDPDEFLEEIINDLNAFQMILEDAGAVRDAFRLEVSA